MKDAFVAWWKTVENYLMDYPKKTLALVAFKAGFDAGRKDGKTD